MAEGICTVSTTHKQDKRGENIPPEQRDCVDQLRAQAFELQKRFDLAEHSALLLQEMLDPSVGAAKAVDNTYEGHAFTRLRIQLFRLLIIDICASVLDRDDRTASVCALVNELRRDKFALDAIKAYYADPTCLEVKVESDVLSPEAIEQKRRQTLDQIVKESLGVMDAQWKRIDANSALLTNDSAKRMLWARNKVVAHFERAPTGLVALDDDPPHGEGKLTWSEPIQFIQSVRPYVYDVVNLITANTWASGWRDLTRFYARAFWDRFSKGATTLKPPASAMRV